jgi:FKBP-type peptidyl-prolyl cis-trans isomerase
MKHILLPFTILVTLSFADIVASAPKPPPRPSLPIEKPIERPIEENFNYRPNQYYIYNPYYDNSYDRAQEKALAEKREKIEALEKELNATRRAEQKELQKKNKAAYDKAMKKFDNRKSSIPSNNKIIISDEPIK